MRPTNRIYLLLGRKPQQSTDITNQFFDINTETSIREHDAHWYRVLGAGGRATFEAFRQPDGEGEHEVLGMRMILRHNHWYVHEEDLDIRYAFIVPPTQAYARALIFIALAGLFALILTTTQNHLFGRVFTWREYMGWCVTVLVWMSAKEIWDRKV